MQTTQPPPIYETQPEFTVHGVRLHPVQAPQVIDLITNWLDDTETRMRYIVSTNINNVVCALESQEYYKVMQEADLSIPDGVPLLWIGRRKGYELPKRCGIEEVMMATFALSDQGKDYSHYFYGNTDDVLDDLRAYLNKAYPNLRIAGMVSPPFRALTEQEKAEHLKMINDAAPNFLWVSLGCPSQETWLWENRAALPNVGIGGGAGAVLNFLTGNSRPTPERLRMMGLEWLVRLLSEPKRLWRRYLIRYPKFFLAYLGMYSSSRRKSIANIHKEQK